MTDDGSGSANLFATGQTGGGGGENANSAKPCIPFGLVQDIQLPPILTPQSCGIKFDSPMVRGNSQGAEGGLLSMFEAKGGLFLKILSDMGFNRNDFHSAFPKAASGAAQFVSKIAAEVQSPNITGGMSVDFSDISPGPALSRSAGSLVNSISSAFGIGD